MRNVKLVLEYDGTDLCGWQRQDNGPTVQEHVEAALSDLFGQATPVTGASRTDAGVHALGQVANFRTELHNIPTSGIHKALNSTLPSSISVVGVSEVEDDFHARFSARGKHYRYAILTRKSRSSLTRHRSWHVPLDLDTSAMVEAARSMVGEHDFAAFQASGCSAKHSVRELSAVEVTERDDEIVVDVRGNAFLRNMVRIIAGTLADVGSGRIAPERVPEILSSRDRVRAGRTAPAHGLYLVRVFYPPDSHKMLKSKGA